MLEADPNYHEFWSHKDARAKERLVIYRQFGRVYYIKLEKKGLLKKDFKIIAKYPTLSQALQGALNYAQLNLPTGWGAREGSPFPSIEPGLGDIGIKFSQLTVPRTEANAAYLEKEEEIWQKLAAADKVTAFEGDDDDFEEEDDE